MTEQTAEQQKIERRAAAMLAELRPLMRWSGIKSVVVFVRGQGYITVRLEDVPAVEKMRTWWQRD